MAAKLHCKISEGLRASEVVVSFIDALGRKHFLRVDKDFLYSDGGPLLPVGIVAFDREKRLALIELPQEAETGANRIWVTEDQLVGPVEAFA